MYAVRFVINTRVFENCRQNYGYYAIMHAVQNAHGRKLMQTHGEHANSMQVMSWMKTPVLQGEVLTTKVTVLPNKKVSVSHTHILEEI